MHLINFFRPEKLNKWFSVNRSSRKALDGFKRYLSGYLERIGLVQEIFLKIADFSNSHFFEKHEIRHLSSGFAGQTSQKLYAHYRKLIRNRLKKTNKLISLEFKVDKKEEQNLRFVHDTLRDMILAERGIKPEIRDITEFKEKFRLLREKLLEQKKLIEEIISKFNIFVGDEKMWESDHFKYRENMDKERIFSDWREFLRKIKDYKRLLREEGEIIIGIDLGEDVATWKVTASNRFRSVELFNDLSQIIRLSRNIIELAQEKKIDVYHATEKRTGIFPLKESMFASGFFVCTENERYARQIKVFQSIDAGVYIKIVRIRIPKIVFGRLFLHDPHMGSEKFGSEEAYGHSYFLPVSRFPEFNRYFNQGVIES